MLHKFRTAARMTPRQIVGRTVGKCFGFHAEHHFTDRVMNIRSPLWRPRFPWRRLSPEAGAAMVRSLQEDGVVLFPGFFEAAEMVRIRAAVAAMFAAPEAVPDLEFREEERFWATEQALAIAPEITGGAVDPDLLNVVGGYFRRGPFLSETDFRRVVPIDMAEQAARNAKFAKGYTSSHWHHDLRGRQIKVQIYLTDIAPGDQNFAFVKGSHRGFKSCAISESRFTDVEIETPGAEIIECHGKAGTAILFDSNGIHRLRRGQSRPRDTVTYYYHPARMYRATAQRMHPAALARHRETLAALTCLEPENRK